MASRSRAFTLIELMVVVSIIAILASIAMPKFAQTLWKAQEGAVKGNLGSLRSALNIYYADTQGVYPGCLAGPDSTVLADTLVPKYISAIPTIKGILHPSVSSVYCDWNMVAGAVHDAQGWYYEGAMPQDGQAGSIWVACDHTDTIGKYWTSY
jgi:general secretion pathway protein G